MSPKILLLLGIFTLTLALRTYSHPLLQRLSALSLLFLTWLAGFFLSGSRWVGALCAAGWLFLPWLDLLTRIRRLTLPLERHLRHRTPPNAYHFPALRELTEEVESEGFEHVDDAGWDSEDFQQFFRLFYKGDERLQAAICLVDQQEIAFYYLYLSSRGRDGTIWTTWNYPFSYSLRLIPQCHINRLPADFTFGELLESHRYLLQRHGVKQEMLEEMDAERIPLTIQQDLREELAYNLTTGVLTPSGEGEVKYSWRGLLYLWLQFLRDLVRLT